MKLNERIDISVEKLWNEICDRGKWEKLREESAQTQICPLQNPHRVTEIQTRDISNGRRTINHLCHGVAKIFNKSEVNDFK